MSTSRFQVWAIADTHLSFAKPREIAHFGGAWADHEQHLSAAWVASVAPEDLVLLPGDISWAGTLNKVIPDLKWLAALPGHKVLLRGNHDHWWRNVENARRLAGPYGLHLIEGDSLSFGGVRVVGAMGHIAPEDPYYKPDAQKDRYTRELIRLEAALIDGSTQRKPGEPLILMMHYPPFTSEGKPTAYSALIERYRPDIVLYGHLHRSREWEVAVQGEHDGIRYVLVPADYLGMKPAHILTVESHAPAPETLPAPDAGARITAGPDTF